MSPRDPNACCDRPISSARCSGVIEASIRCAAAARCGERVEELIDGLRVLGEEVAVLVHEVAELLVGRRRGACASSRSLRSSSISLIALAVLVGGALERLLHARRSAGRAARGRAGP